MESPRISTFSFDPAKPAARATVPKPSSTPLKKPTDTLRGTEPSYILQHDAESHLCQTQRVQHRKAVTYSLMQGVCVRPTGKEPDLSGREMLDMGVTLSRIFAGTLLVFFCLYVYGSAQKAPHVFIPSEPNLSYIIR